MLIYYRLLFRFSAKLNWIYDYYLIFDNYQMKLMANYSIAVNVYIK